jgi:uncharacterized membrane protein
LDWQASRESKRKDAMKKLMTILGLILVISGSIYFYFKHLQQHSIADNTRNTSNDTLSATRIEETGESTLTQAEESAKKGRQMLVGHWMAKDSTNHVVVEYTFYENGNVAYYTDKDAVTIWGRYELVAYNTTQLTVQLSLTDQIPYNQRFTVTTNFGNELFREQNPQVTELYLEKD